MNLLVLRQRRAAAVAAMRALVDGAAKENRELTAEESAQFETHKAAVAQIEASILQLEALSELERAVNAGASSPHQTPAPALAMPVIQMGQDRRELDRRGGFRHRGEFYQALIRASMSHNRDVDERLIPEAAAPSTYGGEGSGAEVGFLVPPEFSREIFNLALTDDALLPLTDQTPVSSNSMAFPKDETTPWGSDGVRGYWAAEAGAANATKPKTGLATLRLNKLMALVPLTDELVADSVAGAAFVTPLMGRSIRWKTNEAILYGTGAGQPLGMFAGDAAVTQTKDAAQAANTVTIGNVTNMIARLVPGAYRNSIWLITPDALPALFQLTLGNYPIYLPNNSGAQGNPYGTLMGRPLFPSQHVPAFSSAGDLTLIAPDWYRTITKGTGESIQVDQSMHLYFDADATAFRAIFRVDGQPKIAKPISQAKGAKTLSPFVQLEAR